MPTLQFGIGVSAGGVSIQQQLNVTADHPNPFEIDVPAGEPSPWLTFHALRVLRWWDGL